MGVGMKLPAQNSNAVGIIIICSIWEGTARSLWHEIEIKYEYFIYLCEVIFFSPMAQTHNDVPGMFNYLRWYSKMVWVRKDE